jgi:FkbM family methyltransferase
MGIYKEIGLRNLGLKVVELLTCIRIFKVKKGLQIFVSLLSNKPIIKLQLNNEIYLRSNQSDIPIFKQVFLDQQYHTSFIKIPKVDRILDIGANIGMASLFFNDAYKNAQIIAIEPEQNNFKQLVKNTEKEAKIECLNLAIWGKNEKLNITNSNAKSDGFILTNSSLSSKDEIEGITITQLLKNKNWDYVDVVKIDIEGAEKSVFALDSDLTWLNSTKVLIIELHDNFIPECTKTFFSAIEKLNYSAAFNHENIFIEFRS